MALFLDVDRWKDKHARRLAAMGIENPGYESIDLRKRRIGIRAREMARLENEVIRLRKVVKLTKLYLLERDPENRQALVNLLLEAFPEIQ